MRLFEKGQGATEYLLMLAAVLVIVAISVYYVTSTGGYPAISATSVSGGYGRDDNDISIEVLTGSIPAGEWEVKVRSGSGFLTHHMVGEDTWTVWPAALDAPYVVVVEGAPVDNYWVSLRHKATGHIYFTDQKITISG